MAGKIATFGRSSTFPHPIYWAGLGKTTATTKAKFGWDDSGRDDSECCEDAVGYGGCFDGGADVVDPEDVGSG